MLPDPAFTYRSATAPTCLLLPPPNSPPNAPPTSSSAITCPTTLIPDNGHQSTSKLSATICELLVINKVTTSSYHPQTNGGTGRVNQTMVQMLAASVNERQNDWEIVLLHIDFAYINSVSVATGLAPSKVLTGRLTRLPCPLFNSPNIGGLQSLDWDQLAYFNLAVDRQCATLMAWFGGSTTLLCLVWSAVIPRLSNALKNLTVFEVGNWAWVC